MILPHQSDVIHQAWLYRILAGIADDAVLASDLRFKGGTCAAMRGFLDRFSVDLDFDLINAENKEFVRERFRGLFHKLGLEIKDESVRVPQFFLKYPDSLNRRSTLKIDVTFPVPNSNNYEPVNFAEINRVLVCQTVETMFANKLVAVMSRFEKSGSIAGRDFFDAHSFFMQGFDWNKAVIVERTKMNEEVFFEKLFVFVDKRLTQKIIDQDINHLMPNIQFQRVRKHLKNELLMFLRAKF
jgi:predicted nucleotidyltransferase component of viral defense system